MPRESAPTTRQMGFEEMLFRQLTPEQQTNAITNRFGLTPRVSSQTTTPLEAEVKVTQQLVGRDIVNFQDLAKSREEARTAATELGLDYDSLVAQELGQTPESTYQIGQIVNKAGNRYRILTLKPDGTPDDVELIK